MHTIVYNSVDAWCDVALPRRAIDSRASTSEFEVGNINIKLATSKVLVEMIEY